MLDSKLARLAFIFIVLSLFFPWFTVSTSSDAEDYQYYYRTDTKEYYGLSEVSITTKLNYETKYDKDSDISRYIIPIDSNLLDSSGEILESSMIVSLMLIKQKVIISIILISSGIINATCGKNDKLTKGIFQLSTIIMLIVIVGFLINVKANYVSTYGNVLAFTDDDEDDKIVMVLPFGYSSITDDGGRIVNENAVDEDISVRWHPSVGFLLAMTGTTLLISMTLSEFNNASKRKEITQEPKENDLEESKAEYLAEAATPVEED